jgi:hypothetical protein
MVMVTPLLIGILVGIIEIGQAIHYHQALSDGTRAGVRYLTRVTDPCASAEQQRAVSLVVTRSLDWSNDPIFDEWPSDYAGVSGDSDFSISFTGCDESGALTGETITLDTRYRLTESTGVLRFIGLEGGFWIRGHHEERYIGL